ncbi:MAG: alpha/beta hydrolase [bacterium]|nr:alpha/beta hydrolase [bacterium]
MQTPVRIQTKRPRAGLTTLRIVLGTYVVLLLGLVLFEARLVYPGAYMENAAGLTPLAYSAVQTVRYQGADQTRLQGRLLEIQDARNVILYLHGNGSQSIWLDAHLERLSQRFEATILAAEFRGFDDNDVTPSETTVVADAQAARRYLCRGYDLDPDQILLYGRSLGGGVAAALAADGGARAVILDRSFDSLVNVAAEHYPWAPVRLLMRNRYDSVARLADYHGPVIQLHGTVDHVVPIAHARALHRKLGTLRKRWIEVKGLGHNDWLSDADLARIVVAVADFR